MIQGRVLHPGTATGVLVRLDETLSFWGGFDPATGAIIDQAHPQAGLSLQGAVVAMDGSRGSSGTPGVLGESLRRGTGPAALLITHPDINLVAGATVAAALYNTTCPIVALTEDDCRRLAPGTHVRVANGAVLPVPHTPPQLPTDARRQAVADELTSEAQRPGLDY